MLIGIGAGTVTKKYTILLEDDLHTWFKHRAVDAKRTLSSLVSEAMEAYRRECEEPRLQEPVPQVSSRKNYKASKYEKSPAQTVRSNAVPKKYNHNIYYPGTTFLNASARAREVDEIVNIIQILAHFAHDKGIKSTEIQAHLISKGIDFSTRRAALSALRDKGTLKLINRHWIHVDFLSDIADAIIAANGKDIETTWERRPDSWSP